MVARRAGTVCAGSMRARSKVAERGERKIDRRDRDFFLGLGIDARVAGKSLNACGVAMQHVALLDRGRQGDRGQDLQRAAPAG